MPVPLLAVAPVIGAAGLGLIGAGYLQGERITQPGETNTAPSFDGSSSSPAGSAADSIRTQASSSLLPEIPFLSIAAFVVVLVVASTATEELL